MKKHFAIILIFTALFAFTGRAQITDTPLRVVVPQDSGIPDEAAEYLQNRLLYLITGYNTGVEDYGTSQFCISAKLLTESKEVVGSAPTMYTLDLDVILYVADWVNDKLYSRISVNVKGAGQSEIKAYINAFKRISPSNAQVKDFLEAARNSIINYYESEGPTILQTARTLAATRQYEEALFTLAAIPSACPSLYRQAQSVILEIYGSYVDYDGQQKLTAARNIWASTQTREGAVKACTILSEIDPGASCYKEAATLSAEIQKQMGQISEMKVYNDSIDLEKQKLDTARQIGVAYGNHQQPSTTNLLR